LGSAFIALISHQAGNSFTSFYLDIALAAAGWSVYQTRRDVVADELDGVRIWTMLETQKGLELPERPILQGGTLVPQEC
jgi:hypothetical protein